MAVPIPETMTKPTSFNYFDLRALSDAFSIIFPDGMDTLDSGLSANLGLRRRWSGFQTYGTLPYVPLFPEDPIVLSEQSMPGPS
ncbi:hypothetical protein F1880_008299 [Penicillium rolfsii]|nr:hypothetical protein F1880_008299 [Penicillium rolfsii]